MSLLWKNAAAFQIEAAVKPRQYTTEMHPDELAEHGSAKFDRDSLMRHHMWGPAVQQLTDSIRQHGYQPELHGHIKVKIDDQGRTRDMPNVSAEGAHTLGMHPMHWTRNSGSALAYALQDAGHGPVPVHVTDERPDPKARVRYFHGTTAEGLDAIHPNTGNSGNFGQATHAAGYAYATTEKGDAWRYATKIADERGGRPRVYEVKPTGPVEEDPQYDASGNLRGNYDDDKRSKHPFTVVREHKPPRDIHKEYYADEPWEASR